MEEQATRIATVPPPPIPVGGVPPGDVRLPWYAVALGVVLIVASVLTWLAYGTSLVFNFVTHDERGDAARTIDIIGTALVMGLHVWRTVAVSAFLRRRPRARRGLLTAMWTTFGVNQVYNWASLALIPATTEVALAVVIGMLLALASIALLIATIVITRRPEVVRVLEP